MTCIECKQWSSELTKKEARYGLGNCKADSTPIGRARAFHASHECHRQKEFRAVTAERAAKRREFLQ
jgi:hypothetical protein